MVSGDKVRIKKDYDLLEKYGLEALIDKDIFDQDFTVRFFSYGWATLIEDPVNQYDWHPDLLILQKDDKG